VPKIVDHDERRDEIAIAACRAIAKRGLESVTLSDIAKEAGRTTGMLAHYYDNKWDLILGALRFMHVRLEQRLSQRLNGKTTLLELLQDALPTNAEHRAEAAAWLAFWTFAANRPDLLKRSAQIHSDWRALLKECLLRTQKDAKTWSNDAMEHVVSSIMLFMDGLYVKAITRPAMYTPAMQVALMGEHLDAVLAWVRSKRLRRRQPKRRA
jgi:AcrR family transcriptional regulator